MTKNLYNKERKVDNPYEVWTNNPTNSPNMDTWEWRILKKWQVDDNKQYARWFCAVKSPMTYDWYEMGDTYVSEIKDVAVIVYDELHPENTTISLPLKKWNVK